MRFRLLPSDEKFFDLFNAAATNVADCSRRLRELLEQPGPGGSATIDAVIACEQRGDELTRDIFRRLNTSFVTPFDREDIHALAYGLDDAMDEMEEAADLINLYEVVSFPSEFAKQVELIQRCAELTAAAMPRLQSLDLEEYWLEIGRLEKAGDKSFRRIITKLFSGNYDALEVLKLKDVVEKLEGAINAFETVAKRVEQIAVKES